MVSNFVLQEYLS